MGEDFSARGGDWNTDHGLNGEVSPTASAVPGRAKPGIIYALAAAPVRLALCCIMRRKYYGAQNLPDGGGFIVVANHVTELDSLTFMHFMLSNGYPVRVLVKSALMKIPVVGFCARKSKMIPVYRGSQRAADSLQAGVQALHEGEIVGLFPEGTLTRDPDLWPMKAHTGAARMALAAGVPVYAVAQWGAHRILEPYGKWHLKPFHRDLVELSVSQRVFLQDLYGMQDDREAVAEATKRIMRQLTAQLAVLRPGEVPPEKVWDMSVDGDRYHRPRKSA